MKNFRLLALLLTFSAFSADFVSAQKLPGLDGSPADVAIFRPGGRGTVPVAKVVYGRPQKKGRVMLGGIEPYGTVWRTGANETTEIKLFRDVTFAGKKIKAGTYSLYTIPDKSEWTIIFNSKLDTWGAYEYDETKDVVRFKVPVTKPEAEVEAFTIAFAAEEGAVGTADMILAWENSLVKIPLKY